MGRSNLRLDALIAAGGMAEVYEGILTDENGFEKRIAVKKILDKFLLEEKHRIAFKREAAVTSKLNHPNIGQVFDFITEDDQLLILCELLEGISLKNYLQFRSENSYEIDCLIAFRLTDALQHAHNFIDPGSKLESTVLHRDISPQNVMLTVRGEIKLIDFGISKTISNDKSLTATNFLAGKLSYLAPELFDGQKPSKETDIYALGVVLFELFTATHPFEAATDADTLRNIKSLERPHVNSLLENQPKALGQLIENCIALNPNSRTSALIDLRNFLKENVSITPKIQDRFAGEIIKIKSSKVEAAHTLTDVRSTLARSRPRSKAKIIAVAAILSLIAGVSILFKFISPSRVRMFNSKILIEKVDGSVVESSPPQSKVIENGAEGFLPDANACYNLCLNYAVAAEVILSGRIFESYDSRTSTVREGEFANRAIEAFSANSKHLSAVLGPCLRFNELRKVCNPAISQSERIAMATTGLAKFKDQSKTEIINTLHQKIKAEGIEYSPTDWNKIAVSPLPESAIKRFGFDENVFVDHPGGVAFANLHVMPATTYECAIIGSSIMANKIAKSILAFVPAFQKPTDMILFPLGAVQFQGQLQSAWLFKEVNADSLKTQGFCRTQMDEDGSVRSAFWK